MFSFSMSHHHNGMGFSYSPIDRQIDFLFSKHDRNMTGYLSVNQLHTFLNQLFAVMGHQNYYITYQQAYQVMYEIDRNCDGRASRRQVKLMYQHFIDNAHRYGLGVPINNGFNNGFTTSTFSYNNGFNNMGFSNYNNMGFNNYNNMGTFSYNGVWNNHHDQYLRNQIDRVYSIYDRNHTGQLEWNEFPAAYRDLCQSLGVVCPNDFNSIKMIAMQTDTNFDGRISKMQLFNLFKRAQFNIY